MKRLFSRIRDRVSSAISLIHSWHSISLARLSENLCSKESEDTEVTKSNPAKRMKYLLFKNFTSPFSIFFNFIQLKSIEKKIFS